MALGSEAISGSLAADGGIRNRRDHVLLMLAESGLKVTLSIGWTRPDGIVDMGYIVIHNAPASLVTRVVTLCVMVSIVADGLLIPVD